MQLKAQKNMYVTNLIWTFIYLFDNTHVPPNTQNTFLKLHNESKYNTIFFIKKKNTKEIIMFNTKR